ncbi:MAG: small subunit ribosomal protein S17, partial [Cellvibrionaceae bacterium]
MEQQVKKTLRTLMGKVVSDKMDKTITVLVERRV